MSFHFNLLEDILVATAEAVRPPERLTVSQAAEKYRYLNNPGSYIGHWDNSKAPYLRDIMDEMTSTEFKAIALAGPARCGKSDMFFNWLTHTAVCDPADVLLVHMTQGTARDWSMGDLRKAFRHSKELGKRVVPGRQNMNVHDVKFMSGMRLLVKWPTITELSGKTVPRVWFMDYDRMPLDVDKEGPPFDLGRKRTETFGRYGMTIAESSPGYEVSDPRWAASKPHEAPPTPGILALYNRGDRRRFYWRCAKCGEPFESDFHLLQWPDSADHLEAAEAATLHCPHCNFGHTHDAGPGQPGKDELNLGGRWIKAGQIWRPDGSIEGTPVRSEIASFWIKGPQATFTTWKDLVYRNLKALEEWEKSGDIGALKATVNTDQGLPFVNPSLIGERLPEDLKARARDIGDRVVPQDVRFLIASIDVQKHQFVVQVHGIMPGGDIVIIDRFDIRYSKRLDDRASGEQYLWLNPATYLEDWHLLVDQVIEKTYPLDDESGRHMSIKAVVCDSGGREGVTATAYNFWRWLRDEHPANHHQRFILLKGQPRLDAPRVRIAYPDSERKDRKAGAMGEVPVLQINSNVIKDQVYGMLARTDFGGGMVIFPDWLESWFYSELTAENRTLKGMWENPKKLRNEAWDLLCYCVAVCIHPRFGNIEKMDWDNPPGWARPWDKNDFVFKPEENATPFKPRQETIDLSALASNLA